MDFSWWRPLLPVGISVVGGWALAMITQTVQARREAQREREREQHAQEKEQLGREQEHYYKVLDRTEDIFARCGNLSNLFFEFSQDAIRTANASPCRPNYERLTVFITQFQSLLASIHMSQRIFYPGLTIDTVRIGKTADSIANAVREMWQVALDRDSGSAPEAIAKRAAESQARREAIIVAYSTELGVFMNSMATSLNKRALALGIQAEPVTVDWDKIKGPTAENTK
jgi:hypothetical protein